MEGPAASSAICIDLHGKVALVTGGSRGIGRATTLTLARAGARVAAVYRTDSEAAQSLREELQQIGPDNLTIAADITKREEVDRLMEQVTDQLGELDILVNNAGTSGRAMVAEMTEDEWQRLIDTDLTSVFRVTHAALKHMRDGGSIVMISGAVASVGQPGLSHYGAAKAGTIGFMRALAKEVGPRGIRANVIASGIVDTDRFKRLPPEARERYAKMTALGRVAHPQDLANAITFLASDLAGFITGAVLQVDGGA